MPIKIFDFIKSKFDHMPSWVQITTFIFFVFTLGFSYYSPKYIDIKLMDKALEFPIIGAIVQIEGGERVLRMVTDTDGRFSVPISFANPLSEYTFVLIPEPGEKYQKDVVVSGVRAFSSKWNKLYYYRSEKRYEFSSYLKVNLVNTAFAGDLSLSSADTKIVSSVTKAISEITKLPPDQVSLNLKLREDLSISNYDLSYISYSLGKKYQIEPWEKYSSEASTVKDLVDITKILSEKKMSWDDYLTDKYEGSERNRLMNNISKKLNN
jgi:hypothetical protein